LRKAIAIGLNQGQAQITPNFVKIILRPVSALKQIAKSNRYRVESGDTPKSNIEAEFNEICNSGEKMKDNSFSSFGKSKKSISLCPNK
jgi:hypothetical protein